MNIAKPIHSVNATYTTIDEMPGQNEQNADEILKQVTALIVQSLSTNSGITGISFSAAMHSLIAVDINGHPLTNAITWADTRSNQQATALKNSGAGAIIYAKTGTPIHPMSPLCKIIWIKETMPQLFVQTHKFISVKEYIFYKFFNKYIIDYSIASATGLFNSRNLTWCAEALEAAGISADALSAPVPVTHSSRIWHRFTSKLLQPIIR